MWLEWRRKNLKIRGCADKCWTCWVNLVEAFISVTGCKSRVERQRSSLLSGTSLCPNWSLCLWRAAARRCASHTTRPSTSRSSSISICLDPSRLFAAYYSFLILTSTIDLIYWSNHCILLHFIIIFSVTYSVWFVGLELPIITKVKRKI